MNLSDLLTEQTVTFMLLLSRLGGLFLSAPLLSTPTLPRRFRFYLLLAITVTVYPFAKLARQPLGDAFSFIWVTLLELLVGYILGTSVQLIAQAMQLAGQMSGTQIGLALANILNPQADEQTATTAVIYATMGSLILLSLGIHRQLFAAVLETLQVVPLGALYAPVDAWDTCLALFRESLIFALRAASPVVVTLMLTEVAMGLVGRTVPQLNFLNVSTSLRVVVGVAVTATTIQLVGEIFADYLNLGLGVGLEMVAGMLRPAE